MHDNQEQITRLKNEVERARAAESAARLQTDGYSRALQRAKKERAALEGKLKEQQKRYEALHQQCVATTEDATRQHVRVATLSADVEELSAQLQQWKEHAAKAKRKVRLLLAFIFSRPLISASPCGFACGLVLCAEERDEGAEEGCTRWPASRTRAC